MILHLYKLNCGNFSHFYLNKSDEIKIQTVSKSSTLLETIERFNQFLK